MNFNVPCADSAGESFTTLLDFLKSWIKGLFGGNLSYIIMVMLVFSAVVSVYDFIAKPDWIRKNHYLSRAFSTTPLYLGSKILGAVFAVMIVFKIGPEMIISADTGATMIDLCGTLFSIVLAFSFILPFLTDCGIMEFLGVIAKPVVRPLFHVPGRASVDLIASWFGASNAAVILTREQYMKGFYTKRGRLHHDKLLSGIDPVLSDGCRHHGNCKSVPAILSLYLYCWNHPCSDHCKNPSIKTIPNTYRKSVGKQINEEIPQEKGIFAHAVEMSCKRAESFNAKTVGTSGLEVLMGMFFDLIPIVVAWGTLALIIATYTPVFDWISYPMGMYLKLLGVPEAFAAAPATLVGFTDMFIPALLSVGLTSVKTKFVIGVLSLVQIIYLTEVGTIIIKSEIPLNFLEAAGHLP